MPIYEFRCEACGEVQEALRRIGQGAEGLACRRCGGERLTKQFSTFAAAGGPSPASLSGGACGSGSCGSSGFS